MERMVDNMKRKTYNNVMKAGKLIQKKGYGEKESLEMAVKLFDELENLHNGMSVEWLIDKIQEKIITVAERIQHGKANHQITHIYLRDANTREEIGIFKHEDEIPTEILQRPGGRDWDRAYGWLTINVG